MRFWRRREETLNEKLLREAHLRDAVAAPSVEEDPGPFRFFDQLHDAAVTGLARPRAWDATATADAPDLGGDEVRFVVLPDGMVLVEDETGDTALAPLADAVERTLEPPYRAEAVRRNGGRWAVGAKKIEVVELPEDVEGDEISIAVQGDHRTVLVDGERVFGSVAALERLALERHRSYVAHAERLDGTLWEVKISPL
jgi:hypothetical protein